ncbi:uncharacterized protein [Triticum aestivum]|uniref:uncharacterized protein isoform X2 n=1 Tax=Triticum aestivum TaxID=4565 RepID=UPI001ABCFE9E|nr:uncharacterized protein LOC109772921 [Aegilops tauschii subsp. strangulata]XP_044395898.1 uncharacterized protein LOC123119974 isoform X2 [Triticum aestivum]
MRLMESIEAHEEPEKASQRGVDEDYPRRLREPPAKENHPLSRPMPSSQAEGEHPSSRPSPEPTTPEVLKASDPTQVEAKEVRLSDIAPITLDDTDVRTVSFIYSDWGMSSCYFAVKAEKE